jgi:hypothetical protein
MDFKQAELDERNEDFMCDMVERLLDDDLSCHSAGGYFSALVSLIRSSINFLSTIDTVLLPQIFRHAETSLKKRGWPDGLPWVW